VVDGSFAFPDAEVYSIAYAVPGAGVGLTGSSTQGAFLDLSTATTGAGILPIKLRSGQTLSAWSVKLRKTTLAGQTVSAKLWRQGTNVQGTPTQIGSTQSNSANGTVPINTTLGQSGLTEVSTGLGYFIEIIGSGTGGDEIGDYTVTVT
jgi:hypothetical protein